MMLTESNSTYMYSNIIVDFIFLSQDIPITGYVTHIFNAISQIKYYYSIRASRLTNCHCQLLLSI